MNDPNQFNTASSYFTNEAILAGLGYPTVCRNPDPEEEDEDETDD